MTHEEIVERMRYARKARGLTIKQLSEKSGVSTGAISNILAGRSSSTFLFETLIETLGLEINVI